MAFKDKACADEKDADKLKYLRTPKSEKFECDLGYNF
jgi:hypothetical protein